MDFNPKIDQKKNIKENHQKSKQKYLNKSPNYILINPEKKSSTKSSLTKIRKKPGCFENILKGVNNPDINMNKQNNLNINDEYNFMQLLDKESDTIEELKAKNKKLREIIIKVSNQLNILYTKYENVKINAENEKKNLLEKLEKISSNYKLYAESYKENIKLKKEKDLLAGNCTQINLIYNSCKNSLVSLIKKNMNYYTKLKMFYENKNTQFKTVNYDDFIFSLKEEFLNNLIQYKNQLDIINYPSFYYEFNLFINEECNYCNYKKQNIKNNNNTTYRPSISIKNDRKENKTSRFLKGNNSYDEYRKYKNNNNNDKSPKMKKTNKKSITLIRQKTPSRSNKNYGESSFNNNYNFNKNKNNYFNNNNALYKNQKLNSFFEDEKNNNIFGDVGNVVNYNKRFTYIK